MPTGPWKRWGRGGPPPRPRPPHPLSAAPSPARPPSALPGLQPGGQRHGPRGTAATSPPAPSVREERRAGAREGRPRAEGRGLSTISNLQKKKNTKARGCAMSSSSNQVPQAAAAAGAAPRVSHLLRSPGPARRAAHPCAALRVPQPRAGRPRLWDEDPAQPRGHEGRSHLAVKSTPSGPPKASGVRRPQVSAAHGPHLRGGSPARRFGRKAVAPSIRTPSFHLRGGILASDFPWVLTDACKSFYIFLFTCVPPHPLLRSRPSARFYALKGKHPQINRTYYLTDR